MRARAYLLLGARPGVGRTSAALALAHTLQRRRRKTLLVDLDPDCHASLALLGDVERVSGETGNTAEILRAWLEEKMAPALDSLTVQLPQERDNLEPPLTMLAGSLHNRLLRERLPFRRPNRMWVDDPATALRETLEPALDRFQALVFDVPVGLDLLALNALTLTTDLIWVDVPDELWTRGMKPLHQELQSLLKNRGLAPRQHGILASRCRGTDDEARRIRRGLLAADLALAPYTLPEVGAPSDERFPFLPTAWRDRAVQDPLERLFRWMETGRLPRETPPSP